MVLHINKKSAKLTPGTTPTTSCEAGGSNKTSLAEDQIAYKVELPSGSTVQVTKPIIDKLTFVFSFADPDGCKMLESLLALEVMAPDSLYADAPKAAYGQKKYKLNVHLVHQPTGQKVLIQVRPSSKKAHHHVRVELNPAKLGPLGMAFFHNELLTVAMQPWPALANSVRVTRVDLACDLINIPIDQLAITTSSVGKNHMYFGIKGKIETSYLAVKKGKSGNITVYNKLRQLKDKDREPKYGSSPHTRVEFRITTKLSLPKFAKLVNPFEKIDLKYMADTADQIPDHAWAHFRDAVRYRGEASALALIPPDIRPRYEAGLNPLPSPLWRTDKVWANWPEVLTASGLLAE